MATFHSFLNDKKEREKSGSCATGGAGARFTLKYQLHSIKIMQQMDFKKKITITKGTLGEANNACARQGT